MKLYVFRPNGYGENTFFVNAENDQIARDLVRAHVNQTEESKYIHAQVFETDRYSTEIYELGQVAENDNS